MSAALKCPNPSCPYLFDPTQVPPGALLTCPRCGMRFTLGPPPPGAYPPAYPPPQPPPSAPPQPEPAPQPATRPAARAVPSSPVSTGNTLLLVVVGVAMLMGVALMVYFRINPLRTGGATASPGEMRERNLTFDPPGAPWVQDDDVRVKLGAPFFLAYRRENPEAFMAFAARDYDTRNPRPSELRDGLLRPLNTLFDELTTNKVENGKWLGEPAVGFEFRGLGKKSGQTWVGESHAVAAKGFAYWSICWTAEGDSAAAFPEFDGVRGRFKLLTARDKWTPKEGTTRPFGGHKYDFQVLDGEGIWSEPPDAKAEEFDPAGNLYLRAKEKRKGRDFPLEAELLVLVLPPAGDDPLAQGVKHVQEARRAEVEKTPGVKLVFTPRTGDVEGDPANPIDETAPVARFEEKAVGARGANRLRVVAARRMGEKVVVVTAWCAWEDRLVFEDRLKQIAGSLREGP
ncbi:MAG: hypothetical protein U0804_25185 [Gemmataceae bacterium]